MLRRLFLCIFIQEQNQKQRKFKSWNEMHYLSQTKHLHELLFQFLIILLIISRFWDDLTWSGRFSIFLHLKLRDFCPKYHLVSLGDFKIQLISFSDQPLIFFKIKNHIRKLWINIIDGFVNSNTKFSFC